MKKQLKVSEEAVTQEKVWLSKAMHWTSRQERCVKEVYEKMKSWGLEGPKADKVIDELMAEGFINESRFCHAFVHDKFQFNHWGKQRIRAELRARGISDSLIQQAMKQIDMGEYIEVLDKLLIARRKSYQTQTRIALLGKLTTFAVRKGYEPDLVYERVGTLLQENSTI